MNRQQRRAQARQEQRAQRHQDPSPNPATGPRTEAGKAISSRNALRHGLTSAQSVLPWESQAEFDYLVGQLTAEHNPQTVTETILVREMAEQWWRLQRARTEERKVHIFVSENLDRTDADSASMLTKELELTRRYSRSFERAFHKNFNLLRKVQKERREHDQEANAEAATTGAGRQDGQCPLCAAPAHQFVSQNPELSSPATHHPARTPLEPPFPTLQNAPETVPAAPFAAEEAA